MKWLMYVGKWALLGGTVGLLLNGGLLGLSAYRLSWEEAWSRLAHFLWFFPVTGGFCGSLIAMVYGPTFENPGVRPSENGGKKGVNRGTTGGRRGSGALLLDSSTWKDQPDNRSYRILQGIAEVSLTNRFPDFDVAYFWAAKPSRKLEDFRETDPRVLEQGVRKCKVKSDLLGQLAGYHATHEHAAALGLRYCFQALWARTEYDRGPALLMVLNTVAYFADKLGMKTEKEWADKYAQIGWRNLPDYYINELERAFSRADKAELKQLIQEGAKIIAAEGVFP